MASWKVGKKRCCFWLAACLALVAVASPVEAQKLEKLDSSLVWLPDDTAFYLAGLRGEEVVRAVAQSKAWAGLKAMPVVQEGLKQVRQAMTEGREGAQIQAFLENPEVREVLALLGDMFSQEFFVYGDRHTADVLDLLQRVLNTARFGSMFAEMTGQHDRKLVGKLVLRSLAENEERIKVPTKIIGFKLRNRERAVKELAKLEGLVNLAALAQPKVAGYLKRTKVGDDEFLAVDLRGDMIPWDQIPKDDLEELEAKPGDAQRLIERAKTLRLTIAVGLRGDYLLVMFGPSTDAIARLGQGKRLIDRPELKPLEKYADRRLVSITYLSQAMAARLMDNTQQLDDLLRMFDEALPKIELPNAAKAKIRKDAGELVKDLKRVMPPTGAILGFDFLTDRGIEGYAYYYGRAPRGREPRPDAASPLALLEHVGGRPIAALVARTRFSVDDYDLLTKWVKVAHGYFEEYAVPTMRGRDREEYDKVVELFQPIVTRFDKTNRELLIPALGAGQCGVVLDAKLALRTIHAELPTFEKPMPMLEPAIVLSISDAAKFRKAMDAYRRIANDAIAALRQIAPHDVPEFAIPEPKQRRTPGGTLYRCPLPEEWGVTPEIAPTLGLSDTVAAFALSEKHADRLLRASPLRLGGLLAQPRRSLTAAGGFDFAGLVDAATPWIELAVREAIKENPGFLDSLPAGDADKSKEQVLFDQLHTVLKALKTIRTITAESYAEGGALVTHTLLEVRDVEPVR